MGARRIIRDGCPTNFSLSCVGFRASHLSSALAVTHDKLKFVGHSPSLHLFLVHTSSGNSTKREAVEPLAALTGMEVCDLMLQRVCRLFSAIFYKFRGKQMFATAQVTQNKARMKAEG